MLFRRVLLLLRMRHFRIANSYATGAAVRRQPGLHLGRPRHIPPPRDLQFEYSTVVAASSIRMRCRKYSVTWATLSVSGFKCVG
jgi:hypothetical protein